RQRPRARRPALGGRRDRRVQQFVQVHRGSPSVPCARAGTNACVPYPPRVDPALPARRCLPPGQAPAIRRPPQRECHVPGRDRDRGRPSLPRALRRWLARQPTHPAGSLPNRRDHRLARSPFRAGFGRRLRQPAMRRRGGAPSATGAAMDLNAYQEAARRTAIYDERYRVIYPALGLASEAGEVAGKIKKVLRDQGGDFARAPTEAIKDELGDVLWYVAVLAADLGLSL